MDNEELLEPLKGYNSKYKNDNEKIIDDTFDKLVKESGIDKEGNIETVKKYDEKKEEIEKLSSLVKSKKSLKTFLIVLIVILFILPVILIILSYNNNLDYSISIPIAIVSIVFAIIFIFLIKNKINPFIKENLAKIDGLNAEANELLMKAWSQMANLNALYDWGISEEIFSKTVPLIKMDMYFDIKKYEYLHDKYGYEYSNQSNVSTYICQSGTILGNPFLLCTDYCQEWRNHTYSGSITIHWTTTHRDSEGHVHTDHHTQVLTAYVTEPEPYYFHKSYLVYGNDAAPNLSFTREPSKANSMDKDEIERYVKKNVRSLEKKERKAISKGDSYTRLDNDDFEVLFGGTNRDNEIEFRLLFTPLAQKNLIDLIETKEPYGDDFTFIKNRKINIIKSKHSQQTNYFSTPNRYVTYDYNKAKQIFKDYNSNFFKSIYFDLAPLMSIPLYQQHKSLSFIYDKEPLTNVSHYEHESMANTFKSKKLIPKGADTNVIYKTHFLNKIGKADIVDITSHAFEGLKRVSYIHKLGGDGMMHSIPVYWIEYKPISCHNTMMIEEKDSSRVEYNNISSTKAFNDYVSKFNKDLDTVFARDIFASLLDRNITKDELDVFNKFYPGNSKVNVTNEELRKTIELIEKSIKETSSTGGQNVVDTIKNKLNDATIKAVEKEHDESNND